MSLSSHHSPEVPFWLQDEVQSCTWQLWPHLSPYLTRRPSFLSLVVLGSLPLLFSVCMPCQLLLIPQVSALVSLPDPDPLSQARSGPPNHAQRNLPICACTILLNFNDFRSEAALFIATHEAQAGPGVAPGLYLWMNGGGLLASTWGLGQGLHRDLGSHSSPPLPGCVTSGK